MILLILSIDEADDDGGGGPDLSFKKQQNGFEKKAVSTLGVEAKIIFGKYRKDNFNKFRQIITVQNRFISVYLISFDHSRLI